MTKKKTPYEVLGVDPKATSEQIKKAHKKRALETHPDRKGNEDEFREVSKAIALLNNPLKKKIYDETGDDGERTATVTFEMALAKLLLDLVGNLMEEGVQLKEVDMIPQMLRLLGAGLNSIEKDIRKMEHSSQNLEEAIARFEEPNGPLMSAMLRKQADDLDAKAKELRDVKKNMEEAGKYLLKCKFKHQRPAGASMAMAFPGASFKQPNRTSP